MGIAQERARDKICPFISFGVGKPLRSAAPQREIPCVCNHAVSQEGEEWEEVDNRRPPASFKDSYSWWQFTKTQPLCQTVISAISHQSKFPSLLLCLKLTLFLLLAFRKNKVGNRPRDLIISDSKQKMHVGFPHSPQNPPGAYRNLYHIYGISMERRRSL